LVSWSQENKIGFRINFIARAMPGVNSTKGAPRKKIFRNDSKIDHEQALIQAEDTN
jgi:hypothetical protein